MEFTALAPKERVFAGLETFECPPSVKQIRLTSDEVTSLCPITHQPDFYTVEIIFTPNPLGIETKSLKLYLEQFRTQGIFAEHLAHQIFEDILKIAQPSYCTVTVKQKSRGGISLTAVCSTETTV